MVFVCPEKSQQRKALLCSLKEMAKGLEDNCCPPQCWSCCPPPVCTPGTCPPPPQSVPICQNPCIQPICVPPILPICRSVPPPCVPICNPNPENQPCVPCNPPQMMVCYKKSVGIIFQYIMFIIRMFCFFIANLLIDKSYTSETLGINKCFWKLIHIIFRVKLSEELKTKLFLPSYQM